MKFGGWHQASYCHDIPHITYMVEEIHGYVKYMKLDGGEGETAVTVAEGYFYGPPAIAVSSDDQPYIVWHDHQADEFMPEKGDAVLAFQGESGWEISTIEHSGHDGWDNDVAVASDGTVHAVSVDAASSVHGWCGICCFDGRGLGSGKHR